MVAGCGGIAPCSLPPRTSSLPHLHLREHPGGIRRARAGASPCVAVVPAKRNKGHYKLVLFNTLVFGSASFFAPPTRFGAQRRHGWAAPQRQSAPILDGPEEHAAAGDLTVALLRTAIAGYPVKLSKASGGKDIEWFGARIRCLDKEEAVVVTLPESKIPALLRNTNRFLAKPVVGALAGRFSPDMT